MTYHIRKTHKRKDEWTEYGSLGEALKVFYKEYGEGAEQVFPLTRVVEALDKYQSVDFFTGSGRVALIRIGVP